jgi:uncharacterized membrane protein
MTSRERQVVRDPVSLQNLWANPEHWNLDGSYNCADDPRLLVRDRARVGWTLNMAHRRAQTAIWGLLIAISTGVATLAFIVDR